MASTNTSDETFMYFGYGSNLLAARIHLLNPSAVFHSIARLDNYRLEFNNKGKSWQGASATVTESAGDHVWGVVWTMNITDLPNLDIQEGVSQKIYKAIDVNVTSRDGEVIPCRTYCLLLHSEDRRPSPQYLDVIIRGAIQHSLPDDYVNKLKSIEHNGYAGPVPIYDQIMACLNNE